MDNKTVIGTLSAEEEAKMVIENLKDQSYTKDDKDTPNIDKSFYEDKTVIRNRYQQYIENNKVNDIDIPPSNN